MIPAFQMIVGQNMPVFPRRIAARPLPTRTLQLWCVVAVLSIAMVITPVPFSNVVPALVIALISLAYLEEDGLLLSIALLAGVIVLAVELMAVLGDDPRREMDLRPLVLARPRRKRAGEMARLCRRAYPIPEKSAARTSIEIAIDRIHYFEAQNLMSDAAT